MNTKDRIRMLSKMPSHELFCELFTLLERLSWDLRGEMYLCKSLPESTTDFLVGKSWAELKVVELETAIDATIDNAIYASSIGDLPASKERHHELFSRLCQDFDPETAKEYCLARARYEHDHLAEPS